MDQLEQIPITQFCQLRRWGLRSRLNLFHKVCLAVHQIHREGRVHGDLHPSKVVVTLRGDSLVPEILCSETELAAARPHKSPEQGRGKRKMDARTDVYSLGLLLYELLTDHPPFDQETLFAVRKQVPPEPSTCLTGSDSEDSINPGIPLPSVRGDLDEIVMKAIEENPARRHPSAAALAGEVRSYLAGDPVRAPRGSVSKVCEFARRRAVPLGLATTITLALAACAAISHQDAARVARIKAKTDRAHANAEGATAETKRRVDAHAPAPRDALPSSNQVGQLSREDQRGTATVTFNVPGDRPDEICVIPRHLPFAHYRGPNGAKDRADEKRLASYDFYKAGTAEAGAIGISPKRTRTSAAVEVYELPAGTSRPAQLTAGYCRSVEKVGKKVAKFKQTDNRHTTTSTASILGYYHVSRALGDICEIKPAVLRTMDIPQHKKVLRLASEMGARGTVAKSWALFNRYYANPRRSGMARDLFTSDYTQIYGALLENTRGEDDYTEWLKAGTNLTTTRAFRHMADSRPARSILGSKAFTQRNVQALVGMRDMSELILLDYLLAQSDRLSGGNISSYDFAYDLMEGGGLNSAKASKAADPVSSASRVIVKKLTIKDTDGGLLNSNVFERKGYLPRIRHMHPRTYDALQNFARKWETDPAVKEFFRQECTFNTRQLARFENYLRTAASTLRQRRESGTLHLDLDLEDYFRGVDPNPAVPQIAASVGRWERGAANKPSDVAGVQRLLARAAQAHSMRALDPRGVDGLIARPPRSSRTVASIEAFETLFDLPGRGVIEPDGPAWKKLLRASGNKPAERREEQLPAPRTAVLSRD